MSNSDETKGERVMAKIVQDDSGRPVLKFHESIAAWHPEMKAEFYETAAALLLEAAKHERVPGQGAKH